MKQLFTILFLATAAVLDAKPLPNIIVILTDDMGYGDPGCYNPESKIPTPHIDRLAAEGLRFTDAHAPGPLCHVSRYGLLTGRYPFRKPIQWKNNAVIDEGRMTIASLLQGAGYQTAMVGKWHLGFFEDEKFEGPLRGGPADRGFHTYFGIRASTDIPPYFYIQDRMAIQPPSLHIEANSTEGWSPIQGEFWRAGGIAPDLKLEEVTPRFTEEAIQVIHSHADAEAEEPLFLYLAYPSPHTPWLPTGEFVGKTEVGLYGDFMHMVDHEIGRVLTALDESKLAEDTLVIFTVDNGPVWYPEDTERFGHDSCGGLRGMKADAWEGGHRMPFLARWPGTIDPARVTEQTICFTDLFATFAELTGQSIPEDQAPDSESFLSVLSGTQPEDEPVRNTPIVLQAGRQHMMIRAGDWKYISGPESGGFTKVDKQLVETLPKEQLYNLRDDLAETNNLVAQYPEKVAELKNQLQVIRETDSHPLR
ncbi:MAG: arylsulfatase [Verrucomicrobiota bacterium]